MYINMDKRVFVVGDIHGRLSALNEVLDAAKFNNFEDRLITLGDICDGGSRTRGVIDRLLQITDRIDILGNHDAWFRTWAEWKPGDAFAPYIRVRELWEPQGGLWTEKSYGNDPKNIPQSHIDFLRGQRPFYIDPENRVFVHGGFHPNKPIEEQPTEDITWNRQLIEYARKHVIKRYNHVFVGHTTTQRYKEKILVESDGYITRAVIPISRPITYHNLTMCDCGAGWSGRLALVNVEYPKEYWLSSFQDPNYEPEEKRLHDLETLDDMTEEEVWNLLP
jgi:serine/threonine protein phosphatase 1